jgi:hypothetical protein
MMTRLIKAYKSLLTGGKNQKLEWDDWVALSVGWLLLAVLTVVPLLVGLGWLLFGWRPRPGWWPNPQQTFFLWTVLLILAHVRDRTKVGKIAKAWPRPYGSWVTVLLVLQAMIAFQLLF